jgi:hypothetical protein
LLLLLLYPGGQVYLILDEFILGGEIEESSKKVGVQRGGGMRGVLDGREAGRPAA